MTTAIRSRSDTPNQRRDSQRTRTLREHTAFASTGNGSQADYPQEVEKMKKELNPTPLMQAAAKQAEAALILANDIVDRVLHEDWHDNPRMVVGVMTAMAQIHTANAITKGFEGIASAIHGGSTQRGCEEIASAIRESMH
jgi:hypothetical protein